MLLGKENQHATSMRHVRLLVIFKISVGDVISYTTRELPKASRYVLQQVTGDDVHPPTVLRMTIPGVGAGPFTRSLVDVAFLVSLPPTPNAGARLQ